ncbi:MAG: sugar transferase, partial [Acidobacteria bacterium]|nr:sugar transferase [Acidobacteriota bacterium]
MDSNTFSSALDETVVSSEFMDETAISSNLTSNGINRASRFPTPAFKECREPFLKRPLDILISLIMILASAPISILVAIAIKLEDGGPIFY